MNMLLCDRMRAATVFAFVVSVAGAQNCGVVSVGRTALTDLGAGLYQGFEGGLYAGGLNTPPTAHAAAGLVVGAAVLPRTADGSLAASNGPPGRVVLCSIGMSNATQEFSTFMPSSNADVLRRTSVTVVDCAQGGVSAAAMADPSHPYWSTTVPNRLLVAGVTDLQVQVVWIKSAVSGPSGGFPSAATTFKTHLRSIVQNAATRFPNLRIAYVSSRAYAGYATAGLSPEPYAYESGFAVKWLIEDQIAGDPGLNYAPENGPVLAPWIGWGPYLWADGLIPRSDGLVYECRDFASDGTHPGVLGRFKIAALLDAFFRAEPTAAPWYVADSPHPVPAAVFHYGVGAGGMNGPVQFATSGGPVIGATFNGLGVSNAAPGAIGTLFVSTGYDDFAITGGSVLVDLGGLILPNASTSATFTTNASGFGGFVVAVPNDPALFGLSAYAQIAVADGAGQALPEYGGFALTRGMRLIFGF